MQQPRQHLIVGTRTSRLARWQSAHVIELLADAWPNLTCELHPFETTGDRKIGRPLPEIGGKGLFTAELEAALLSGAIDVAVHSLKDLPVENPSGLTVGAVPAREDACDALVASGIETMATLKPGAVVGTSSLRRQAQILAVRPDLQVRSIRGNVETRARKAREGDYDAVVLAAAGLKRLDMVEVVSSWLPLDVMLPAPGQGALAVQCRAGDEETLSLLRAIEDVATRRAVTAERQFLKALGGGCSAPIAAYACSHADGQLELVALVASVDGGALIRVSGCGSDPNVLAEQLASQARSRGAEDILAALPATGSRPSQLPLSGLRIVVTRPRRQASAFASRLRELGALPILFPTIRIAPFEDTRELDSAIQRLQEFDWVVFTSVNGVAVFWQRVQALNLNVTHFGGVRVATIGPATADALLEVGVKPDFIPDEFVAEQIVAGLGDVSGQKILLPRAAEARAVLAEQLRAGGAQVEEIASYRTTLAKPDPRAVGQLKDANAITFTSSSTVRNFVTLLGGAREAKKLASGAAIACIGPITASTAHDFGLEPNVVAEEYTIEGLTAALLDYFASESSPARKPT
ncbi:MAG TPA: hydroxymethylbilane synthase [Candidatus Binatia bacterium]|nr:hydroxymethylbilane synthase [Candidatus Binatia bacterium]